VVSKRTRPGSFPAQGDNSGPPPHGSLQALDELAVGVANGKRCPHPCMSANVAGHGHAIVAAGRAARAATRPVLSALRVADARLPVRRSLICNRTSAGQLLWHAIGRWSCRMIVRRRRERECPYLRVPCEDMKKWILRQVRRWAGFAVQLSVGPAVRTSERSAGKGKTTAVELGTTRLACGIRRREPFAR